MYLGFDAAFGTDRTLTWGLDEQLFILFHLLLELDLLLATFVFVCLLWFLWVVQVVVNGIE